MLSIDTKMRILQEMYGSNEIRQVNPYHDRITLFKEPKVWPNAEFLSESTVTIEAEKEEVALEPIDIRIGGISIKLGEAGISSNKTIFFKDKPKEQVIMVKPRKDMATFSRRETYIARESKEGAYEIIDDYGLINQLSIMELINNFIEA